VGRGYRAAAGLDALKILNPPLKSQSKQGLAMQLPARAGLQFLQGMKECKQLNFEWWRP
jgi:hypothetical protein